MGSVILRGFAGSDFICGLLTGSFAAAAPTSDVGRSRSFEHCEHPPSYTQTALIFFIDRGVSVALTVLTTHDARARAQNKTPTAPAWERAEKRPKRPSPREQHKKMI